MLSDSESLISIIFFLILLSEDTGVEPFIYAFPYIYVSCNLSIFIPTTAASLLELCVKNYILEPLSTPSLTQTIIPDL